MSQNVYCSFIITHSSLLIVSVVYDNTWSYRVHSNKVMSLQVIAYSTFLDIESSLEFKQMLKNKLIYTLIYNYHVWKTCCIGYFIHRNQRCWNLKAKLHLKYSMFFKADLYSIWFPCICNQLLILKAQTRRKIFMKIITRERNQFCFCRKMFCNDQSHQECVGC